MAKVTFGGVQKLLHLDVEYANFPTWEEVLKFEVDGVQVKAIATHSWRENSVRIIEPFEVEGRDYLHNFCPPLIALGAAMTGRARALAARGLTVRDECIRMATYTYCEHSMYLRLKPEIDRNQEAFYSVFRDEIEGLLKASAHANDELVAQKRELKQKLRDKTIELRVYEATLKSLQKNADECRRKHFSLEFDVDLELREIKSGITDLALTRQYPGGMKMMFESRVK